MSYRYCLYFGRYVHAVMRPFAYGVESVSCEAEVRDCRKGCALLLFAHIAQGRDFDFVVFLVSGNSLLFSS